MTRILILALLLTLFACKKDDCHIDEVPNYTTFKENIIGSWVFNENSKDYEDGVLDQEYNFSGTVIFDSNNIFKIIYTKKDTMKGKWFHQYNPQIVLVDFSNFFVFTVLENSKERQEWFFEDTDFGEHSKYKWVLTKQ